MAASTCAGSHLHGDSEVDDGDLDAHLGQVVRVGHLGGHVELGERGERAGDKGDFSGDIAGGHKRAEQTAGETGGKGSSNVNSS